MEIHPRSHSESTEQSQLSTEPSQEDNPYRPFKTKQDYDLADECIRNNLPVKSIDRILSTHHFPGSPVTLKNHKMLFDVVDLAAGAATMVY